MNENLTHAERIVILEEYNLQIRKALALLDVEGFIKAANEIHFAELRDCLDGYNKSVTMNLEMKEELQKLKEKLNEIIRKYNK